MSHRISERVSRPELERRILQILDQRRPLHASTIADRIWPGHQMTAQGAAGAAGYILGAMRRRRLVRTRVGGWCRS